MSSPTSLELPDLARAYRLGTSRGEFAVVDARPPRPPLGTAVLVPGFTGSKEDFLALLEPLTQAGFRVVAVDQRGQYESGGPRAEAAYAQRELALDLVALTETWRGDGPLHVLGHSFGGLVARAAVLDCGPVPWASLAIMSSGPGAIDSGEAARLTSLLDMLDALGMAGVWEVMSRPQGQTARPAPPTSAEIAAFLRRRWLANVPEQLLAAGRQLLTEPDRVAELASAGLPTLVLSGASDEAWPVPWMDEMAKRLGAQRVVIEGAGHSPNVERPEATARALITFWRDAQGANGPFDPRI